MWHPEESSRGSFFQTFLGIVLISALLYFAGWRWLGKAWADQAPGVDGARLMVPDADLFDPQHASALVEGRVFTQSWELEISRSGSSVNIKNRASSPRRGVGPDGIRFSRLGAGVLVVDRDEGRGRRIEEYRILRSTADGTLAMRELPKEVVKRYVWITLSDRMPVPQAQTQRSLVFHEVSVHTQDGEYDVADRRLRTGRLVRDFLESEADRRVLFSVARSK